MAGVYCTGPPCQYEGFSYRHWQIRPRSLPRLPTAVAAGQLDEAGAGDPYDRGMNGPATVTRLRKPRRAPFAAPIAVAVILPTHIFQCVHLLICFCTRVHGMARPMPPSSTAAGQGGIMANIVVNHVMVEPVSLGDRSRLEAYSVRHAVNCSFGGNRPAQAAACRCRGHDDRPR